jgi:hypothetical protein
VIDSGELLFTAPANDEPSFRETVACCELAGGEVFVHAAINKTVPRSTTLEIFAINSSPPQRLPEAGKGFVRGTSVAVADAK